jgi:hypothetical protein
VVVGGEVVVVVLDVDPEPVLGFDEVGVVVVVDPVDGVEAVFEGALAPGCSLATSTPIAIVAPVASTAATRVSWRRRASVCRLISGVLGGMRLTGPVLVSASSHESKGA